MTTRLPTLNFRVPAAMRPILTWTVMASDSYKVLVYGFLQMWVFSNGKTWTAEITDAENVKVFSRDWPTEKTAKVAAEVEAARLFKSYMERMQSFIRRRADRRKP